jgi:predicted membrane-bound mannosyltransferase
MKFFPSLSLPWYLDKDDVETVCATNQTEFQSGFADDAPPVVIARDSEASFLDGALGEEYERSTFYLRTAAGDRVESVVYVRQ